MLKPGTSKIQSDKKILNIFYSGLEFKLPWFYLYFLLVPIFLHELLAHAKNIAIDAKFHQSKQKIVLRFISLLCIKWFDFIKANSILEPYMKYFAIDKFHQIYINCFLLNILIDKKWLKLRLETEKLKPKKSYRQ